ncbi:MAG: PspC domain-containing protein [Firmicutes bacterium]|nr:PspC domain-containing protein [Bacillota bacterium]
MEPKKLYRSRSNSMISGICGGFAEYLGLDPTVVRLLYLLLTLFTAGTALIFYFIAMFIIPLEQ